MALLSQRPTPSTARHSVTEADFGDGGGGFEFGLGLVLEGLERIRDTA